MESRCPPSPTGRTFVLKWDFPSYFPVLIIAGSCVGFSSIREGQINELMFGLGETDERKVTA